MSYFDENYATIKAIADDIFKHPELGYKEFRTKQIVIDYIRQVFPKAKIQEYTTTGLRVDLDNGADRTMGILAELDALINPTHFQADPETKACHACGHFSQVAIALDLFGFLTNEHTFKNYNMNFSFVFVPAEEFIDLDYRQSLIDAGKVTYSGGKAEMMKLGAFDGIDFMMATHSIGNEPGDTVEINCDLAGFLHKYYTFIGKAAHAGFDPFSGINAYSMSSLFNVALGMIRQQIREDLFVRINPVIANGNFSINVIPNQVTVSTDVRTIEVGYMKEIAARLDDAAEGSSQALGGQLKIKTQMGYLPFVQDRYLNQFVQQVFDEQTSIKKMINDRGAIAAAGDIGDLSYIMPCIQISYGGFQGDIHGDNFRMVNPEFVLKDFPEFLSKVIERLDEKVEKNQLYHRPFIDYAKYIDEIIKKETINEE